MGSEFKNWHLRAWCHGKNIQLTRGRAYKKDDNAHVEQKNWTSVPKAPGLGSLRFVGRGGGHQ
jgi:transposase InsO family protein